MARRWLAVWLVILGLAVSTWTRAAEPPLASGDLVLVTPASLAGDARLDVVAGRR